MSKHTSAPWRIARVSKSTVLKDLYVSSTLGRIARVCVPYTAQSVEEYEANARLIASAPDLLDALEKISKMDVGNPYARGCAEIARTAIAKVTKD